MVRPVILLITVLVTAHTVGAEEQRFTSCGGSAGLQEETAQEVTADVTRPERTEDFKWECSVGKCLSFLALEIIVNSDGSVRAVRVSKSSGPPPQVRAACVPEACNFKFKPATRHGKPVAVRWSLTRTVKCN
jgi:hypothetical protein